jgi:bifunctional DNA-binding transcriptional regulator/antitoxin component of YhaV-PrlF toxin-antitoxin module
MAQVIPLDMVRTTITSKGQTTIPIEIRKKWKTSHVVWEACPDGSARIRPVADIMSVSGIFNDGTPPDPKEKEKARTAMGRNAAKSLRRK